MPKTRSFVTQLVIVGGFIVFLYIFFALTTSVYKDYKLDTSIGKFEDEINLLAEKAQQKPKGVAYYQSSQYKDRYAKENLNLLNPGEHLIIIPQEEKVVKSEVVLVDTADNSMVLKLPNRNQWWEYFFGHTLSLKAPPSLPGKTYEPTPEGESPVEEQKQG
jgi:hypothetical protein